MTEALEDKLIDLRERVDDLLAKQKAYRRKHLKTKQLKQQSKTKKPQGAEPLNLQQHQAKDREQNLTCLLYTSPSPRDRQKSRMPSSA